MTSARTPAPWVVTPTRRGQRRLALVVLVATSLLVTATPTMGGRAVAQGEDEAIPVIQVAPNPPLDSRDVRVFGRDFCADPDCSSVTITLDGRVLLDDVAVQADGTFAAPIRLETMPGEHEIAATQTAADGTELRAQDTVTVPAVDYIEDPPPAPADASDQAEEPPDDDAPADEPTADESTADGAGGPTPGPDASHTATNAPLPPATSPISNEEPSRSLPGWVPLAVLVTILAGLGLALRERRRR